jgi:hypothetical protein
VAPNRAAVRASPAALYRRDLARAEDKGGATGSAAVRRSTVSGADTEDVVIDDATVGHSSLCIRTIATGIRDYVSGEVHCLRASLMVVNGARCYGWCSTLGRSGGSEGRGIVPCSLCAVDGCGACCTERAAPHQPTMSGGMTAISPGTTKLPPGARTAVRRWRDGGSRRAGLKREAQRGGVSRPGRRGRRRCGVGHGAAETQSGQGQTAAQRDTTQQSALMDLHIDSFR